mmetsp:Transcript_874/g.1038  ORF Transcript_874/g.1038 Transcript_874/m.1038 type:complete len:104 (-) Transcript_874:327-638(-)
MTTPSMHGCRLQTTQRNNSGAVSEVQCFLMPNNAQLSSNPESWRAHWITRSQFREMDAAAGGGMINVEQSMDDCCLKAQVLVVAECEGMGWACGRFALPRPLP